MNWLALGLLVVSAGVALTLKGSAVKTRPRGIRNNNPGNLILTDIPWKGKVPREQNTDGRFEQFIAPEWGIRAMFLDIRGDIERDGKNTIEALIAEYAPPNENQTAAYIAAVAREVGHAPDLPIMEEHYLPLIKAIIRHENGEQPYSDDFIRTAMALA